MKNSIIVPTILVKSKAKYLELIKRYEPFFSIVQIDVLNNSFVKTKSYYCRQTTGKLKTNLKFELHLMIDKPLNFIKRWKNVSSIKRIYVHAETITPETFQTIKNELKNTKIELALAINPQTDPQTIKSYAKQIKTLMLLAVKPGKNGAPFINQTFTKIKQVKRLFPKLKITIDGGVGPQIAAKLLKAGADQLAVGSYLKNQSDIRSAMHQLLK